MTELPVSALVRGATVSAKPYVEFRAVCKSYGETSILKDFSLKVPKVSMHHMCAKNGGFSYAPLSSEFFATGAIFL